MDRDRILQVRLYSNTADLTYPFSSNIPFEVGLIQDIKIVVKKQVEEIFVTSIATSQKSFILHISSQSQYLGAFEYKDNLWITLNNQNIFGFVLLNHVPIKKQSYSGKWYLYKQCVTYTTQLRTPDSIYINSDSITDIDILNLNILGNLQYSIDGNTVIISRSEDALTNYYDINIEQASYITKVNNVQCKYLNIISSDSSIQISGPTKLSNNSYYLFINTLDTQLACQKQIGQDAE